jgi:hypothetical protein
MVSDVSEEPRFFEFPASDHSTTQRHILEDRNLFKLWFAVESLFVLLLSGNVHMSLLIATVACSTERVLRDDDRPLEILQEWGPRQDQVKFILRYTVLPSAMNGKC